jgi:hypothetical protein
VPVVAIGLPFVMSGALVKLALAAAAAAAAASGSGPGAPSTGPASLFGGSSAVPVPQAGRIEIDLESAKPGGLRPIACAGAPSRTTACFVAGR